MGEVLQNIDWTQVIYTVWSVVLLPVITYMGKQIAGYSKMKRIDRYTDILYQNVVAAVKDVYETTVKDIKGTGDWTDDRQKEVKEIAKNKAVNALTSSAYQILKTANEDFENYLDSLIGTALYDLKNNT